MEPAMKDKKQMTQELKPAEIIEIREVGNELEEI